jgi:putative phage-type endonuclease
MNHDHLMQLLAEHCQQATESSLSEADLLARRNTLGSSEIAAVAGVNPYASAHNVWLAKVHGQEFEGNERTMLGNILEPTVLAIYANRYCVTLKKGVYTIGPEPWMAATPDSTIVESGGLAEAKVVGLRSLWMWGPGNTDTTESDAVPLHYLCQTQWQMLVTGAPFVDICALLGTELRNYRIRPSAEVQSRLLSRGRDFWERYVLTRTPPPADASEGAREMLKRLYPQSEAEAVAATPELEQLAEQLRAARELLESAKEQKQLAENLLKERLKDARGAHGAGWRIRYTTQRDKKRPFVFEHEREKGAA